MGRKPITPAEIASGSVLFVDDDALNKLLNRLLTIEQISVLTQAHPSTIKRMADRGDFPKPVVLSAGVIRWRAGDYNEWVARLQPQQEIET